MARRTIDTVGSSYRRFNDWLRGELKVRGMTQKDLARMLGTDPSTISFRFSQQREWTFREVLKVCDLFDCDLSEII